MKDTKVLTIQDISCVGQCSLTVALPIISACGIETSVLPSAVLSTHTAGFKNFTVRDLSEDFPAIRKHWESENIRFDAVYTGYLGSAAQIEDVKAVMESCMVSGGLRIVDPAMGDNGKLYPAFDLEYAKCMKTLCDTADIVLPNITEASFLTGSEYREEYDEEYVKKLCRALGAKTVVLTGVGFRQGFTGVYVYENGKSYYYEHKKITEGCHGTGDVYAAAFTGALMNGKSVQQSARIAADYVVLCIEHTKNYDNHWYGVKFEPVIPSLIDFIKAE